MASIAGAMIERAAPARSGLVSSATRCAAGVVFGATAMVSSAPAVAAPSSNPPLAAKVGGPIERQDTVVTSNEQLAQAGPAKTGTPASTATPGFGLAELKSIVPERAGAWRRKSLGPVKQGRVQVGGRSVVAKFARGKLEATLTVGDLGSSGNAATQSPWRGAPVDRGTATGNEKIYAEAGYTVREDVARDGGPVQVTLILPNGIIVGASGTGVGVAQLKQLAQGVDLERAAALVPGASR